MEILKIQLEEQVLIKKMDDKVFDVVKNPKYGGYQTGLASMVYTFFDKNIWHLVEPLCLQMKLQSKMKIYLIKN